MNDETTEYEDFFFFVLVMILLALAPLTCTPELNDDVSNNPELSP